MLCTIFIYDLSSIGQRTSERQFEWKFSFSSRATNISWWLGCQATHAQQSHFRSMAEISFPPSANTRKRASASREDVNMEDNTPSEDQTDQKMFTLKKWNAVAMWSWDVECVTCAICRMRVIGKFGILIFNSYSSRTCRIWADIYTRP